MTHELQTSAFCDIHVHRATLYISIVAIILNVLVLVLEFNNDYFVYALASLLAVLTIIPLLIGNLLKKSWLYFPFLAVYFTAVLAKITHITLTTIYAVYNGLRPKSNDVEAHIVYITSFLAVLAYFAFQFYYYGVVFKSFIYLRRSYVGLHVTPKSHFAAFASCVWSKMGRRLGRRASTAYKSLEGLIAAEIADSHRSIRRIASLMERCRRIFVEC
uniref:G protein-coupled receptor n=2 Tax=Bursaphelenchus xylophilus TaxID=6326 RepID=A0A1I7RJY1_BURXY